MALKNIHKFLLTNEIQVNTKHKMVDKKVKYMAGSLWKGRGEEVVVDPSLSDMKGIGHIFIEETWGKLQVSWGRFLLLEEELKFQEMWEWHGKPLPFFPKR